MNAQRFNGLTARCVTAFHTCEGFSAVYFWNHEKAAGIVIVVIGFSLEARSDLPHKAHSEFTFARVQFTMNPRWVYDYREAPWHHDYPFAEDLYLSFIKEVTGVDTSKDSYEIVKLDSPDIFKYPFLYFSNLDTWN